MFRNNRNKQKTNRNSSKFVKISTFLIPHNIRSVCFGCFNTGPKHRNKPKFFDLILQNKQTKKQPKQIEFRFVSVRTGKNTLTVSRTPNREGFWRFFWVCFDKVLFVSVVSIPVRNTETYRKKCFLV